MKKFKKILIVLMVGVMFTVLTGCGGPKPSQVVDKYLKLYNDDSEEGIEKRNRVMETYTTLLSNAKNQESNKYTEQALEVVKDITNDVMTHMTYKINSEKIDKDTSTVNVTVKRKDLKKIFDEVEKNSKDELDKFVKDEVKMNHKLSNDDFMKKCLEIFSESSKEICEKADETSVVGDIELNKKDKNWIVNENKEVIRLTFGDL